MKRCFVYGIAVLLSFLSRTTVAQQDQAGFFEHISISEGLSHVGVNTICQDSKGFLWIGTYDGLNRYDGLNFRVFNHKSGDSTSLINNRVKSILETHDGKLWIGTEEGLCIYDPGTEKFKSVQLQGFVNKGLNVIKLFEDNRQRLWVLSNNNNIYIIQRDRNSCRNIYYQNSQGSKTQFYDITSDNNGNYYLASSTGLLTVDADLNLNSKIHKSIFSDYDFQSITIQNDSLLWLGSGNGVILALIDRHNHLEEIEHLHTFYPGKEVRDILVDRESNIWAAMNSDGLKKIIHENGEYKIQSFRSNAADNNSLSSNRLRCLFEDRQGILWIGTTENGMNKYNLASHVFFNIGIHNSGSYGLSSEIILSFLELEKDRILVGTREKGVFLMNSARGQFIKPNHYFNPLREKSVSTMFIDSRDILWIRTWDALYCLLPHATELLEIEEIEEQGDGICEDDFGYIWLVTRSGLKKLHIGKENHITGMEDYSLDFEGDDSPIITKVIYNDPFDHTLWLGTYHKGLIKIDVSSTYKDGGEIKFRQYTSGMEGEQALQSNFVSSILRTSEDEIWVGTEGGGISHGKFTSEGISFSTYDEASGLSNNVVKAILEDASGNLWISTNIGLNKFLKESGQFIVYDRYDGLPSNYFTSAALLMSDNRMIMGGNKGLTVFDPSKIKDNPLPPIPEFGSFQLFYQTVLPLEKINNRILLPQSIAETDHLKLAYNQNTFSFELLALHFSNPRTNRFKYKLHGFDDEWIYFSKGNTFANYAKVKPGRYTFEFFAANSHGHWSAESKKIDLSIKPPWWWNKYVIVFYASIVIAIFMLLLRNSRRILDLKHQVRIEEIESLKIRELNESKLKFFMNVSHEFKTPISLITGPVQWLLKHSESDSRIKSNLALIKNQTDYLLNLLDQLVYFRKADTETLELKCQHLDIIPFIENIKKSYEWQSKEQRIDLTFAHPESKIMLWFDPKSMDKVFHNLISNAFKYSRPGSRITLTLYPDLKQDLVHVSVKDTGIGIPPEKLSNIFERFYQEDSSIGGYGIGLSLVKSLVELHKGTISVNSIPGQGTEFTMTLLIGKDHLKDNQIGDAVELPDPEASSIEGEHSLTKIIGDQPEVNDVENKALLLLVEDNVRMLTFLKNLLQDNFRLLTALNGQEAIDLMKSDFPDLIISDVMMPEMDGLELCDRVKKDILTCHIPVILLSAKGEIESQIEGLEHGADHYIPKPVDIDLLQAEIKSVLYNRDKIKERVGMKLPFDISSEDLHPMDRELLMKVKAVAEENYHDPGFDSNLFSKKLYINRSLFYKKMKALTNQTPSQFLRVFRMNKAVELITKEKIPISEVNDKVGILSRSHFTKCFKDTYGTLPSQFLQSHKYDDNSNL